MSEPFLAEIKMVGFDFAPRGFANCDGQLLSIGQNQSLFALLGTTYGGDGRSTFGLPDLRGRAPMHVGAGFTLGQRGGEERHILTLNQLPRHGHLSGSGDQATSADPNDSAPASQPRRGERVYGVPGTKVALQGDGVAGSSESHENMQPSLALRFVIALQGLFPSRN